MPPRRLQEYENSHIDGIAPGHDASDRTNKLWRSGFDRHQDRPASAAAFTFIQQAQDPNSFGSTAIGIRWDTIGSGIKAIGLGHHIWARVGGVLVMSAGNTLKVIGKEIAAGSGMTITGTVIDFGTIVRENGIGSTIAGSSPLSRLQTDRKEQEERSWSFSGKRRISNENDF